MRLFLLSYVVDESTTVDYFSVDVNEDGLKVKIRRHPGGELALSIAPNKWNMIEIDVFEDPIDDVVMAKISRKAEDLNEMSRFFSRTFEIWENKDFNLSPKSSHYSKKNFNLEFSGKSVNRQRSWIKDLTFIGSFFS